MSDPSNARLSTDPCKDEHDEYCIECEQLLHTINKIINFIDESAINGKDGSLYDAKIAKENIFKWVQHLIRHTQQNKAKHDVMEKLDDHSGLLPKDFANAIP